MKIFATFSCCTAERDAMHPQSFLFNAQNDNGPGRHRRAVMPPITFTAPSLEKDGDYWENLGQDILRVQLQKNTLNKNVAKNVIMFLGDGMSIPTLAATRIYMGGEEKVLSFEKFPYNGLSKVRMKTPFFRCCWYKPIILNIKSV